MPAIRTTGCKPLLRWAGSKRQLLAPLRPLLPSAFSVYVEPFCGSAALFFAIAPKRAILGDANCRLINFYLACQHNPNAVLDFASSIPRDRENYMTVRAKFNIEDDQLTQASHFYFLNKNCFNGLFRTNSRGDFNVPFAAARTGAMPSVDDFRASAQLLNSAIFKCGDFQQTIEESIEPHAFYFIDPPYAVSRRKPFAEYINNSFTVLDIDRLKYCLDFIDRKGAKFIMTYDADKQAGRFRSKRKISGD